MNKLLTLLASLTLSMVVSSILAEEVEVVSVTAQQRYPWNGLVDIYVKIKCNRDDISDVGVFFAATNIATGASLPINHITQKVMSYSLSLNTDGSCTDLRDYIWDAKADVGAIKINELDLTVSAVKNSKGVQLWSGGPYFAQVNVGYERIFNENGYYFWWGDTVGCKSDYSSRMVSLKDGSFFSFSRENCPTVGMTIPQLRSQGYIDSTGNLTAGHDPATAYLGMPWRMPTDAECAALLENCDITKTSKGFVVTGRGTYSSRSIIFPAVGYGSDSKIHQGPQGSQCYYWSSTPDSGDSQGAWGLSASAASMLDFKRNSNFRGLGMPVRAVRD